ncbi:ROK family transcriptional regulator [Luteimicrobium xylanilyticum]|uniref:Glucokinase n=1 Tax=Luteimicrobium xylanilyticum TaxID=1133546 RepID=A0A5P9Q7A3_9MICO|nr:ROK family transcriptional regulator [Luteimicrobium xylanilyticum]QFU97156.1 Glucokinase [Luteimicrobium xylanilyticum]
MSATGAKSVPRSPGSQASLREANRQRIVDTVKHLGRLTQVELAAATGLSTATVSTIVKTLVADGVLATEPTSRSGRRALEVSIARQVGVVAALHVGARTLSVALGDLAHAVIAERDLPLPPDHRADTTLDRAALILVGLLENLGTDIGELRAIGVAISAPVDRGTGLVLAPGALRSWRDVPVAQVLEKRLARPVHIDSDANLAALAELAQGPVDDLTDMLYLQLSHEVSAGLVLGGRVYRGSSGTAGQIGHIQVDPRGPVCRCGNRGCLDTEAGEAALVGALRTSHGDLTLRDVVRLSAQGDSGCERVLSDAARRVGEVAGSLVTAFDPRRVVVGGELAEAGDVVVGPIREAVERVYLRHEFGGVEVLAGTVGTRAPLLGALELARRETRVVPTEPEDEGTDS